MIERTAMRRYVLIALLFSGSPALAALLSVDVFAPGDGLATRDTESGLEWLDSGVLAGTTGTVKDYLDGNIEFANELADLGFDIAGSSAQYVQFLNHAGATLTNLPTTGASEANAQAFADLYSLGWLVSEPFGCFAFSTAPFFRDMSGLSDPYSANGFTGTVNYCESGDGTASISLNGFADSVPELYGLSDFAMVRTAIVPVPAALPLFMGGIGALLMTRRRSHNATLSSRIPT